MAFNIYACLALEEDHQTSPSSDSPLCSPKNTSLNFLRGFPKSPPADMVADKEHNLDYFYMFLSFGVSSDVGAQGILLSSQTDGNAAQRPPVNLGSFCACATSPISILHLSIGPDTILCILWHFSSWKYAWMLHCGKQKVLNDQLSGGYN